MDAMFLIPFALLGLGDWPEPSGQYAPAPAKVALTPTAPDMGPVSA